MLLIKIRNKLINCILAARREYREIWKHKYKVNLGVQTKWTLCEKVKYNRLGFTNEDYYNFGLRENDYHDYISYRERLRLENINGRFAYILGEKLMFERIFGRYINVPHIHCWIKKGKLLDLEDGAEADIISLLEQNPVLIAKPTRSVGGGTGIHRIAFENGNFSIDGTTVSREKMIKSVSSWEEYIVVDYVYQADYANEVFPATTNSIRIITALRKSGAFEVILAFHRFGSERSKPVDNISSGGLVALIDIDTGVLSKAKRKTDPENFYSVHPDSKQQIEGVAIPDWDSVKKKLLHVHSLFPFYRFFAWDVVIDQNGEACILEINRGSDLGIQMIAPLRDQKMGEFMREYGLLDKR